MLEMNSMVSRLQSLSAESNMKKRRMLPRDYSNVIGGGVNVSERYV